MLNLKAISHITFDCYGTLIDWENGILEAMLPMLRKRGVEAAPEKVLHSYVTHEAQLESQSWRPYRQILGEVAKGIAADFNLSLAQSEADLLPDSISTWRPFPDTVPALHILEKEFKLAILSNIDDALFAPTRSALQASFVQVITAEQLRSYKPAPAHFQEALGRLNVPPAQILHVAQSLYHDVAPARQLGFGTAWINRPSRLAGVGVAPAAATSPDITATSLEELVTVFNTQRNRANT